MKILGRWDATESNTFIAQLANDLTIASSRTTILELAILDADATSFKASTNNREFIVQKPGMYEFSYSMIPTMYSGYNSALVLVPVINNAALDCKKATSFTARTSGSRVDPLQNTSRTVRIRLAKNDSVRYEAYRIGYGYFYVPADGADFAVRRLYD